MYVTLSKRPLLKDSSVRGRHGLQGDSRINPAHAVGRTPLFGGLAYLIVKLVVKGICKLVVWKDLRFI